MMLFSRIWFLIKAIFYPVRLLLYWIHGFFVFVSKPGARIIVPLVLLGIGIPLRGTIDSFAGAAITNYARELEKTLPVEPLFEYRVEIAFLIALAAIYIALTILARVIRPIIGALPPPTRPLTPIKPFQVPKFKVAEVVVKIAVPKLRRSSYKGKIEKLSKNMQPNVQHLISFDNPRKRKSAR